MDRTDNHPEVGTLVCIAFCREYAPLEVDNIPNTPTGPIAHHTSAGGRLQFDQAGKRAATRSGRSPGSADGATGSTAAFGLIGGKVCEAVSAGPAAFGVCAAIAASRFQFGGGSTRTMLPHFGQARICPMAAASRTRSVRWQVVQVIEKSSKASGSRSVARG